PSRSINCCHRLAAAVSLQSVPCTKGRSKMQGFLKVFREFAVRGNVIDLAVAVVIGAAFTAIVNSLVNDIIMPPIGLLMGGIDFSEFYINLSGTEYASLAEAQAAGAPLIRYGIFINAVINFLIVALAIFLVVKQI